MKTNFEMVKEFHEKFGVLNQTRPALASAEETLTRIRLILEEFDEYVEGTSLKDIVKIADALADLLYVVYGTADVHGIDIDAVFKEVHRSNMTKTPAVDVGGKIQKGPDFEPPDIEGVLDSQIRNRKL